MYEQFYGLTGKPFQIHPDPGFFYGSRRHRQALAYLQYGIHQREGFIVLTGDVGAGKTTLIRNMIKQIDPTRIVAAQLVSTQLDPDELLQTIATAFGLTVRDQSKARLLHELELYFVTLVKRNQRALLIVDEAQNLPPKAVEELRMLSNFQHEDRALHQSCLVGQPELRDLMTSPGMQQLRQRVVVSYHLSPLDSDETRAYIEHRLKHVGWTDTPRFSPLVFDRIHSFTHGVPRRINLLCDRLLLHGYLSEKKLFELVDVDQVISELIEEQRPSATAAARLPSDSGPDGFAMNNTVVVRAGDLLRLERRVARIEKALATVLALLRTIGKQNSSNAPVNKEG